MISPEKNMNYAKQYSSSEIIDFFQKQNSKALLNGYRISQIEIGEKTFEDSDRSKYTQQLVLTYEN